MVLLPPVRRVKRRTRDVGGSTAFLAGALTGGLAVAAVLFVLSGLFGTLTAPVRHALLALVVGYLALVEVGVVSNRLGGRQQLIPQTRFRTSLLRGMYVFGVELGVGFRTRITHMGPYLLVAMLLLTVHGAVGFAFAAIGWALGRWSAFIVRLAQQPVIGDLDHGQLEGQRQATRYDTIMQAVGVRATQTLFGGAAAVTLAGLTVLT